MFLGTILNLFGCGAKIETKYNVIASNSGSYFLLFDMNLSLGDGTAILKSIESGQEINISRLLNVPYIVDAKFYLDQSLLLMLDNKEVALIDLKTFSIKRSYLKIKDNFLHRKSVFFLNKSTILYRPFDYVFTNDIEYELYSHDFLKNTDEILIEKINDISQYNGYIVTLKNLEKITIYDIVNGSKRYFSADNISPFFTLNGDYLAYTNNVNYNYEFQGDGKERYFQFSQTKRKLRENASHINFVSFNDGSRSDLQLPINNKYKPKEMFFVSSNTLLIKCFDIKDQNVKAERFFSYDIRTKELKEFNPEVRLLSSSYNMSNKVVGLNKKNNLEFYFRNGELLAEIPLERENNIYQNSSDKRSFYYTYFEGKNCHVIKIDLDSFKKVNLFTYKPYGL